MTTDPPETRATWKDVLAEAERRAQAVPVFEPVAIETRVDTITANSDPPPERDPSNLNDPALQRWVVAFAWLLTLVLLGTCVAGGACLLGAFRSDAESEP